MEKINKNLLVTTSLIGSIKWFQDCPPSWKEKAEVDLHNTLARIWTEPEPGGPIDRGIKFEKTLYSLLEAGHHSSTVQASDEFKKMMDVCEGGRFQVPAKSIEKINGQSFCLYGKLDVDFPMKVVDIKTTGKPKEKHSYLDSFQHVLYLYLTKKPAFEYHVAVFGNEENPSLITDVCSYRYESPGQEILQGLVYDTVTNMMKFFEQYPEYWDLYITKFSRF